MLPYADNPKGGVRVASGANELHLENIPGKIITAVFYNHIRQIQHLTSGSCGVGDQIILSNKFFWASRVGSLDLLWA